MSDKQSSSDEKRGMVEAIGDSLGFDISKIREELEGDQHDVGPADENKGPVRHPTDEDVVETATETLIDHKQRDRAHRMDEDVEDHRVIEVQLDIDDPMVAVHRFASALYERREDLLGYLYENSLFDAEGPSLEATEDELITYIIDERDDDPRPAAFLGGATPLRINLANRNDFTEDEKRLIKLAHEIAARENGYDRHLLLDEVIIIPLTDPGENPYN